MIKIKLVFIMLASFVLILTACGKQTVTEEINIPYAPPTFELTDNDMKLQAYKEIPNNDNTEVITYNPKYEAAEIILVNNDNSVNYIVDGSNIIYNGKTFIGLNEIVNSIELPYDLNTFINFVIKTYKNDGNTNIQVELFADSDGESEDTYITIHDSLLERAGYSEISDKYNDYAVWSICVYTGSYKNMSVINGCKSFLVYNGDTTLTIDMSQFDSGSPYEYEEEQTEEPTDATEEPTDATEESEAE